MSANNRYELLFSDEEGGAPVESENVVKKKQPAPSGPATAVKKSPAPNKKGANEKENKANALNKNENTKRAGTGAGAGAGTENGGVGKSRPRTVGKPDGLNVNQKSQSQSQSQRKEGRDYRNNQNQRANAGSELSNGQERQQSQQQYRERDNRGPPRRYPESGYRVGKREFDRQSGSDKTGVKAVDKRDGAGAHNWGSVKQEIEDINKSSTESTAMEKDESGNEQSAEQAEQAAIPEEDDESKMMTLDEWKALHQQRAKPQYNLRKAGEGEDMSQWKKMTVLKKNKGQGNDDSEDEEYEYDPSMYPQRVGRLQRIVDIQFNFSDNGRRSGSGVGRGRFRGGQRPGGDRGRFERNEEGRSKNFVEKNRDKQRIGKGVLKVDDERQFPSLS